MGNKKQMIIEIDEDSNVTLETKGFKGAECITEVKRVTKGFSQVGPMKKTKEYYEKAKSKIKNKISRFSK